MIEFGYSWGQETIIWAGSGGKLLRLILYVGKKVGKPLMDFFLS